MSGCVQGCELTENVSIKPSLAGVRVWPARLNKAMTQVSSASSKQK